MCNVPDCVSFCAAGESEQRVDATFNLFISLSYLTVFILHAAVATFFCMLYLSFIFLVNSGSIKCTCTCDHSRDKRLRYSVHWRIQDFPEVGTPTPKLAFFAFYCRKLHENDNDTTRGGGEGAEVGGGRLVDPWRPSLDKLMRCNILIHFEVHIRVHTSGILLCVHS